MDTPDGDLHPCLLREVGCGALYDNILHGRYVQQKGYQQDEAYGGKNQPPENALEVLGASGCHSEIGLVMRLMSAVPLEETLDAFFDLDLMLPAQAVELLYRGKLAHCTIGLGAVPLDRPSKAYRSGDELRQCADTDFLARADIDVAVAYGTTILWAEATEVGMEQDVHGGIRHIFAPKELAQRASRSPQTYLASRDAEALEKRDDGLLISCAVFACDRSLAEVGTDSLPVALLQAVCKVDLADHSWENVAILKVKVVVRPVEIGRHHGDVVRAVLQVEALAHLEPRDLCYGIGLIRVL